MPKTVIYILLSLMQFKEISLTKSAETEMDFCLKNICKDKLFNAKVNNELKSDVYDPLLETAPCPPPWEMSLLFSSSLCLGCQERIKILKRCLRDWDIEIDCENILSCDDCILCGICEPEVTERYFNQTTNKTDETDETKTDDAEPMLFGVSVLLSFLTIIAIIILGIIWYKKRRSWDNRLPNHVSNVETQITLLKQESMEPDSQEQIITGKLLAEQYGENLSITKIT